MIHLVQNRLRRLLRQVGVDVHRFPQDDGIGRCVSLMASHGVDLVVDVGASDGGFARDLRARGYKGDLLSLEPLPGPFQKLAIAATRDPRWTAVQSAVGDRTGTVRLNVAGNNGESSSVLPMLDTHLRAAPDSRYVAVEQVPIDTLDNLVDSVEHCRGRDLFLKIDVQGYERAVLEGTQMLAYSGRIAGLQIELSLVELYEDALNWRDAFDWAQEAQLAPVYLRPGFSDRQGMLLQFDAFFFRQAEKRPSQPADQVPVPKQRA